ncbi:hypothetical protein SAMN05421820_101201 [Pedobacter steynii]|uniref:Uncharacterized protein n=1 Tax=Pedobacter steynii TaxID=430522 RepID=A0A1G9JBC6_9SPHI|nr:MULTISPECIES: hypothetical protein [Pedobacter]NQX38192.1 hypothetical protein [Pedobacter steynii]SDL34434.1 hypothetical protein SAMN05421820_101201 [Pedobacter steynii]
MKPKQETKEIKFKKRTIEYLNIQEMKAINGGGDPQNPSDTTNTLTITYTISVPKP